MKILFQLPERGYLRMYGSTVELLAERGHRVLLAYDTPEKRREDEAAAAETLAGVELVAPFPWRPEGLREGLAGVRPTVDYLRYLDRRFADAHYLRDRMTRYIPRRLRPLARVPRPFARPLLGMLLSIERLTPASRETMRHVRALAPDAIVVSPLIARGGSGVRQTETVKAARRLGVPVGLAVGSWDHLTTKGIIKAQPDRVFVWNDVQRREAVELHRVRRQRVVVTGAQLFDGWFDRSVGTTREAFTTSLGLDPGCPYVLYVGSSPNITQPGREEDFVRRWIAALRAAGSPLSELGVLIRPHPGNVAYWSAVDLRGLGAAVAPRERPSMPMTAAEDELYFHSIAFSVAVVGINTSAIIESLVQRKPVLTIRAAEFHETQEATLHFHYLRSGVRAAGTIDEHVEQLSSALDQPEQHQREIESFLASFVRPHGLDRPATPILADAIEGLVRMRSGDGARPRARDYPATRS